VLKVSGPAQRGYVATTASPDEPNAGQDYENSFGLLKMRNNWSESPRHEETKILTSSLRVFVPLWSPHSSHEWGGIVVGRA